MQDYLTDSQSQASEPAESLLHFEDKTIFLLGKYLKIAHVKGEWDIDINNPEELTKYIKNSNIGADIFSFIQRLPESEPKFSYYYEMDNVAAIPISTYEQWITYQVKKQARNKVRKAKKQGVIVKKVEFSDTLMQGLTEIINETPIRQGRLYKHYGKDFETVKKEHITYLERSDFLGAYYDEELIGFLKLAYTDRYVRTMGIISKIEHRDKAPMNALIATAVQICADKNIPYLIYGQAVYGNKVKSTLNDFKRYNGFVQIDVPRYYIPLSVKGKTALRLGLHRGMLGILPENMIHIYNKTREKIYSQKYSRKAD
jgi:hypothetical protein